MGLLLEFNVVDRFNTDPAKVREMTFLMLEEEADVRGWKDGYTMYQTNVTPVIGGVSYTFTVEGEYDEERE